jgi:hypothetical protein
MQTRSSHGCSTSAISRRRAGRCAPMGKITFAGTCCAAVARRCRARPLPSGVRCSAYRTSRVYSHPLWSAANPFGTFERRRNGANVLPRRRHRAGAPPRPPASVDLDFFRPESFDPPDLLRSLDRTGTLAVLRGERDTLTVEINGVATSFFAYPHELVRPLVASPWSMSLAAVGDIAAMKLSAIAGRGSRKDFVDL